MPVVTPVSSVPIGVADGGGIVTRVTYETRLAANDAAVATAANDARYVARAVTIGRGTIGEMLLGVGSRLAWPLLAASVAYEGYKWYKDSQGQLTQPGQSFPSVSCGAGDAIFSFGNSSGSGCSVPAAIAQAKQIDIAYYTSLGWSNISLPGYDGCVPSAPRTSCAFSYQHVMTRYGDTITQTKNDTVYWGVGDSPHTDPSFSTDPTPVTNDQLGQLAEQHPDWWPQLLNDPQTGNPVITPEIASDMDALKHQIAPQYGVDPTTLPQTTPDPNYQTGQAVPREQSLPQYCAWAAEACNYYKFVEDNWPDAEGKKQETDSPDCISPPSCSGDQVMCAVVRNTWATKCQFSGTAPPPVYGGHVVSELDQPDKEVGDPSGLDTSGFGWGNACPFNDLDIPAMGTTVHLYFGPICDYGPWLRGFILLMAGLKAAQIVAGLRDVAA